MTVAVAWSGALDVSVPFVAWRTHQICSPHPEYLLYSTARYVVSKNF